MAFMESPAVSKFKELRAKYPKEFGRRVHSYEFPFELNMGGSNLRAEILIRPPMSCPFLALEVSVSRWVVGLVVPPPLPSIEFQDLAGSALQSAPNPSSITCGPGIQRGDKYLTEPKYCEILIPGDGVLKVILTYPAGTLAHTVKGTMAGVLFRG